MGAKIIKIRKYASLFAFFYKNMIMRVTCYPISRRINGY